MCCYAKHDRFFFSKVHTTVFMFASYCYSCCPAGNQTLQSHLLCIFTVMIIKSRIEFIESDKTMMLLYTGCLHAEQLMSMHTNCRWCNMLLLDMYTGCHLYLSIHICVNVVVSAFKRQFVTGCTWWKCICLSC